MAHMWNSGIQPDAYCTVGTFDLHLRIMHRKGAKQVGKITSGEKGKTVTTVCCMIAGGTFVPPMLIFLQKEHVTESAHWSTNWNYWMCKS